MAVGSIATVELGLVEGLRSFLGFLEMADFNPDQTGDSDRHREPLRLGRLRTP